MIGRGNLNGHHLQAHVHYSIQADCVNSSSLPHHNHSLIWCKIAADHSSRNSDDAVDTCTSDTRAASGHHRSPKCIPFERLFVRLSRHENTRHLHRVHHHLLQRNTIRGPAHLRGSQLSQQEPAWMGHNLPTRREPCQFPVWQERDMAVARRSESNATEHANDPGSTPLRPFVSRSRTEINATRHPIWHVPELHALG